MKKILLVSSNDRVVERWHGLLASNSPERAGNLGELRRRCAGKEFDLILIHRPLVDTEAFAGLRRSLPRERFFLLSDQPSEDEGMGFLKAGISGYGNTYMSPALLAEAVKVISNGGVWLGQKIIQRLIMEMAARSPEKTSPEAEQSLAGLTKMERKVAYMVAWGKTNLEIAADLGISERTVKAHLTSIYGKTRTGSRLSLALLINRG